MQKSPTTKILKPQINKNEDNLLNSTNKFRKIQKLETKMKIIHQIKKN
jgi:hypothetical protein